MRQESRFEELFLSVLGYQEESQWAALALEMDLRGYGPTFEDALDELAELIEMQISFAIFKGQLEMIWKPAEPIWFQLYADARRERTWELYSGAAHTNVETYRVAGLPIPSPHVIATNQGSFQLANA